MSRQGHPQPGTSSYMHMQTVSVNSVASTNSRLGHPGGSNSTYFCVLHSTNISPLICFMHSHQHTLITAIYCFTDRDTIVCSLAILSFLIYLMCRINSATHHYVTCILFSDTLALITHTASKIAC
jgi:hypothetical protein